VLVCVCAAAWLPCSTHVSCYALQTLIRAEDLDFPGTTLTPDAMGKILGTAIASLDKYSKYAPGSLLCTQRQVSAHALVLICVLEQHKGPGKRERHLSCSRGRRHASPSGTHSSPHMRHSRC
jgi:hypothetical protein